MRKWIHPLLYAGCCVLLGASAGVAQSVVWSAQPAVFVDSEFSDGTEVGPALALGVALRAEHSTSFAFDVLVARTDFDVAADALHRNYLSASLAVRFMTPGAGSAFGVTLGGGVLVEDDVNETDPDFRSSSNVAGMFVPGVVGRYAVGESWGLTGFVQDHVTGLFDAIFDPDEGDLGHQFSIGVGVYFR